MSAEAVAGDAREAIAAIDLEVDRLRARIDGLEAALAGAFDVCGQLRSQHDALLACVRSLVSSRKAIEFSTPAEQRALRAAKALLDELDAREAEVRR